MHYPDHLFKKDLYTYQLIGSSEFARSVFVMRACLNIARNPRKRIWKKPSQFTYQFQYIHADVGEQGKTKEMVKEVTGLIRANGFEPRIKPMSFAASVVADRYNLR